MSFTFESEVIEALRELLKTEANYDIVCYHHVGEKPEFKEFHAHRIFMLYSRPNYLKSISLFKSNGGKYAIRNQILLIKLSTLLSNKHYKNINIYIYCIVLFIIYFYFLVNK